ncbi:DUF3135 domain-containing protein [Shewanella youngdeokensis]|uniref:DUF3135 domain-containing protein n=1 Tax=Shewanella youngdeokensis TaxID=2999068 RepID=A0ABZ0JUB8_9GAMM|nr:DUF3135 domain-containing protein [Shewanella sp. DAU334]
MTKLPDFDTLRQLAENEPEKLNALQEQLNKEVIKNSSEPNRANLISLYDHLQKKLSLCKTPYQRQHVVSSMMYEKLSTLNELLNHPNDYYQQKAKVISFITPVNTTTKKA